MTTVGTATLPARARPTRAAAGAAAALALGMTYFSKAGDVMSPADGKTRVSTKEGGLFELSGNDDLAAAPGLFGGGGGGMDSSPIVNAIEKLGSEIAQLKFQVNMDGAKVAEGISKVNSRSNSNSFGAAV